ncbi:DUF423 domain-containing protein [Flagellimonas hymeniacidonis]|uniref:DUF423 domain-containing protein n=1 Tax=Flagellimonas hymeniacidonis TaxID=2603628 RepID=A0A5C8V9N4_9FLAO|nr:DUF423 domain-containing protein [Flagellimonas hymeniacidonis]TXN38073.1 DUF423 domain-containing protein [Flagellimonas hymeniacidonis]
MNKTIVFMGAVLGFLSILFGAFGAHALENLINVEAIGTFETGVRYQMYQAFFLMILGTWNGLAEKQTKIVFRLILVGTILFSFSIYLLAMNSLTTIDFKKIGFLTPIGGTLLLAGWFLFGYSILTKKTVK